MVLPHSVSVSTGRRLREMKEVARRVVTFLEDRRLLFGKRHAEDELECVHSAVMSRAFLTEEPTKAKAGKSLSDSLRAMRAAFRQFVDAAGPNARNFRGHCGWPGMDPYSTAPTSMASRSSRT
jgi:hypothetical protein